MTLFGHAVSGIAAYGALRPGPGHPWGLSRRMAVALSLALPCLPDLDVFMHFWYRYQDPLGHRGIFHSLGVAALVGLLVAVALRALGQIGRTRRALAGCALFCGLLVGSHGITDAMTTGGRPVMLLWPLSEERFWLPWRFIPVSPFGRSLVRERWTPAQLRTSAIYRRRVLADRRETHVLVRAFVRSSDRPDHARRLAIAGIAATELLVFSPLALVAMGRWVHRRLGRSPPAPAAVQPPPEAPARRRPGLAVPAALAGVALAALAVALALRYPLDAAVVEDHGELHDRHHTPWVRVRPVSGDRGPVAVLVHGWRCSHQLMLPLARMLARNGVTAYAIDMPGHASSRVPMDLSCARRRPGGLPCRAAFTPVFTRVTSGALAALHRELRLRGRPVVLSGHSSGAVAAHDAAAPSGMDLAARIPLEGAVHGRILQSGNHLFVGRPKYLRHYSWIRPDVLFGRFEDRTAYRLLTTRVPHIELIRDAYANRHVLDWIRRSSGMRVGRDPEHHYALYVQTAFASGLFGAAVLNLAYVLARRRDWLAARALLSPPRPWTAFLCLGFGACAAVIATGEVIRAGEGWDLSVMKQSLPVFLRVASSWVALPFVILALRPARRPDLGLLRDVGLGVAGFLAAYLSVGASAHANFFHVELVPLRLPRFLGWAALFLPLVLVLREAAPAGGTPLRETARFAARVLLWCALLTLHASGFGPLHEAEVLHTIPVFALAEACALAPEVHARSRLAGAVTVSLFVSWFLTTSYPFIRNATA